MAYGDSNQPDAGMHQGPTGAAFWKGQMPENLWQQNFGVAIRDPASGAGGSYSTLPGSSLPATGGWPDTSGGWNTAQPLSPQEQALRNQQQQQYNQMMQQRGIPMTSRQQAIANQNRFAGWNTLAPEQPTGGSSDFLDYLKSFNAGMAQQGAAYGAGGLAAQYGAQGQIGAAEQNKLGLLGSTQTRADADRAIASINDAMNRYISMVNADMNRDVAKTNIEPANTRANTFRDFIGDASFQDLLGGLGLSGGGGLGGIGGGGGGGGLGGGGLAGMGPFMGGPYQPPAPVHFRGLDDITAGRQANDAAGNINQRALAGLNQSVNQQGMGERRNMGRGVAEQMMDVGRGAQTDIQKDLLGQQRQQMDYNNQGNLAYGQAAQAQYGGERDIASKEKIAQTVAQSDWYKSLLNMQSGLVGNVLGGFGGMFNA